MGTLALLTRLTEGRIPPFQLMAMTFALAFLLMNLNWWRQGHLGLRHLRQPKLAWLLGVGGYFGYHFCYFLAMTKAPAITVSLLAYMWPLLIVLLAAYYRAKPYLDAIWSVQSSRSMDVGCSSAREVTDLISNTSTVIY